ncbi:MAG: hypothetical protein CSA45_04995 [Gammaproteobacteria bacterium]|nr:MAG: hypothetical protein CSA45_04995 [Gammaproteobacteria bacterium]
MKKVYLFTCVFTLLFSLSGCERNQDATLTETLSNSVRSGSVSNEDVAAPLSEKAQRYEKALEVSNRFLELWYQKDFKTIADTLIDPEMQGTINAEKLADIHKNVEAYFGPMMGFKRMQWAFEPKRKKRQYFLFSIKVVHHEKEMVNYLFQFLLDGGFEKLIGFYVREKPALRAPGQIHNNIQ